MRKLVLFIVLSISVAASPAFAGHDHGSQGAMAPAAAPSPTDDQNAKESEMLIINCTKLLDGIYKHIQKLQSEINGKRVGASVRDELKKLEENLKEANYTARSLHMM